MSNSNDEKYDKILAEFKNLNKELFDRKTGMAVEVHDNTEFRKGFVKDKLKDKIYSSFRFYQSSKKHLWAFYIMVLGIISFIIKEFAQ